MFAKSILAAAFMAGSVLAQSSTQSSVTISTAAIAAEVSTGLKSSWCTSQQNVCKLLCNSAFQSNTCNPNTLVYNCTCNNGTAPGLQYYKDTIDTYTCLQAYADCITAHPNDQLGQDGCTANIRNRCGTLDVANYTSAAAQTTAPATTTAAGAGSATSATSATTPAATTSNAAVAVGKEMGFGLVGAGLFAAFGFLL